MKYIHILLLTVSNNQKICMQWKNQYWVLNNASKIQLFAILQTSQLWLTVHQHKKNSLIKSCVHSYVFTCALFCTYVGMSKLMPSIMLHVLKNILTKIDCFPIKILTKNKGKGLFLEFSGASTRSKNMIDIFHCALKAIYFIWFFATNLVDCTHNEHEGWKIQ